MLTQFKCSAGHAWEPANASSAPLVCPTCGRPPLPGAADADRTIDTDNDRTIDLPSPPMGVGARMGESPASGEVTQTLAYSPMARTGVTAVPAPTAPARGSSNGTHAQLPTSPFTIIRQHARGGLGLVNLARDEAIKREVALKQILPQHADNPTLKRRFLYEAQITGQLEHPSIVPVYSLGTDSSGAPYYIMRFVRGRTLDAIIVEHHASPNPIVFRELLRRFISVCQAVAYAHSRGIIHRDLKPSNVMLGDYGETLVLDWGLAKDIKNKTDPAMFSDGPSTQRGNNPGGANSQNSVISAPRGNTIISSMAPANELTMEGQVIGTPAYMAPEQAEGRTELHAPVTDIYALGGILYKILTGQSPQAPTASTAGTKPGQRRLIFTESAPPSKWNKDVDPILEKLCLRAMAPDPAARYQRALELAQDIQRWMDEHPLSLRPATAFSRIQKNVQKHAVPLLVAAGLLIVLLGILLIRKS